MENRCTRPCNLRKLESYRKRYVLPCAIIKHLEDLSLCPSPYPEKLGILQKIGRFSLYFKKVGNYTPNEDTPFPPACFTFPGKKAIKQVRERRGYR